MASRVICNECLKVQVVRRASVVDLSMTVTGEDGTVRKITERKSLCDEHLAPAVALERLMRSPAADERKRPVEPPAARHPLRASDINTSMGKAMLAALAAQGLRQL